MADNIGQYVTYEKFVCELDIGGTFDVTERGATTLSSKVVDAGGDIYEYTPAEIPAGNLPVGVGDVLKVAKADPPTARELERRTVPGHLELGATCTVNFTRALNGILEADSGATESNGVEIGAVLLCLVCPLAKHTIGLATATSAAMKDQWRFAIN